MGEGPTIFYVDEQEGDQEGKKFTAVCIAYIRSKYIHEFRASFYSWFMEFLLKNGKESGSIGVIPVIHGSDLLRDFTDSDKLLIVKRLLDCFVANGGKFRRVGYFNHSIQPFRSRIQRISFCVVSAFLRDSNALPNKEEWMIVSEIDLEGIRAGFKAIDGQISQYYQVGMSTTPENISINYEGLIGHFFAMKNDLGCQVADVSGYMAYKAAKNGSGFGKLFGDLYSDYENSFSFNQIITMKIS